MKSSEVLKRARRLIKSGEQIYVCLAVEEHGGFSHPVIADIETALGDSYTVDDWLCENVVGFDEFAENAHLDYYEKYDAEMRAYRLRWIDHMIAQYEAEGN